MAKKRSDGRYCETFRFNGKRYSVYAKSIPEVRAKAQEKLRSLRNETDEFKKKQKLLRFAISRGFDYGDIIDIVEDLL